MLETLITSKTRMRLLLKFFTNSGASAHLRGLAKELDESTNAVRIELNKLSDAGILVSFEEGNTKQYQANQKHPLFPELSSLVKKYLGLDTLIEDVIKRLGDIQYAFMVGDYARGVDTGIVQLCVVGYADPILLDQLIKKAELLIHRRIEITLITQQQFEQLGGHPLISEAVLLWHKDG